MEMAQVKKDENGKSGNKADIQLPGWTLDQ